ncbi:hypothetical protein IAI10_21175 [Clostridium sp. 19966]|uniref:hypothetical protein n=1 Tax=Clostridium sp. 19966 TaxID=2768166 RepID=UPI0028DF89AD|nr:hypothetical protein [Clostridium sp. 19966]MDT8719167.1 hypothetical protein [Clostridium sp. 19966]
MKNRMIEFLLNNANPSIKRRIKSEILNNITQEEAAEYQRQILQEPNIKRTIACQKENGWLGNGFHGTNRNAGQFENMETCTKYLGEKAVDKDTPVLKRAMDAFITVPLDDLCYGTRGIFIDEFKTTGHGYNLIRCACIARAGYDDMIDISPQIQLSLDSFKRVLEVDSVLDVSRPIKKGRSRVFKDYERWPCRYHLDILGHTNSWKNEDNIKIIADSIKKMMKSDSPELVNLIPSSWVGYALGTLGGFPSQGFSIKTSALLPNPIAITSSKPDLYNLEYIEWLARCGVVPLVPALRETVNDIANAVSDDGVCRIPVVDAIFKGWGPYAGLQLETDWKSNIRRDCDITFRALLILHYSNIIV